MKLTVMLHTVHRYQAVICLLVLAIQRSPAVKFLADWQFFSAPRLSHLMPCLVASVVGLGAFDTLSGATTVIANPSNNYEGEQDKSLVLFAFADTPGVPGSWSVTGSLPPGVNFFPTQNGVTPLTGSQFNHNSRFLYLRGTPSQPGQYQVTVTAWRFANKSGDNRSVTFTFQIRPTAAPNPFADLPNLGDNDTTKIRQFGSFGFFADFFPWIYHFEQNTYFFVVGNSRDSLWMYDLNLADWVWINESFYPFFFHARTNTWWQYLKTENAQRHFWDYGRNIELIHP